jgi:hypothetical protein
MQLLQWKHPTEGKIEEPICNVHELQTTAALKILGIGYTAIETTSIICWRCIYNGYAFKDWIHQALNSV